MSNAPLSLPEELLLLALHDEKGSFLNSNALAYGLVGAVLVELVERGRLALEEKFLVVVDDTPTGDGILDDHLAVFAAATRRRKTKAWVRSLPGKVKKTRERVAERLVERAILRETEGKVLWMFTVRRFPQRDPRFEREIRDRIRRTVAGSRRPDDRTVALVALMGACGLTKHVIEKGRRREANRRIKEITKSSAMGRAVKEVMDEIRAAVAVVAAGVTTG